MRGCRANSRYEALVREAGRVLTESEAFDGGKETKMQGGKRVDTVAQT